MTPPPRQPTEADHAAYLLTALQSFGVLAEERFDALAVEHLRRHRLAHRVAAVKSQMLLDGAAYRVELRGRAYLCRLRLADETDACGRPLVVAWDVGALLDALCRAADGGDPAG